MRKDALLAVCIGVVAIVVTAGSWGETTRWHPDSLFYEAQLLEVQGVEAQVALDRVLSGPLADGVSAVVGDPEWVEYNRDFYRRGGSCRCSARPSSPLRDGQPAARLAGRVRARRPAPLPAAAQSVRARRELRSGPGLYRASVAPLLVGAAADGQLRRRSGGARPARGRARPRPGSSLAAALVRRRPRARLHP